MFQTIAQSDYHSPNISELARRSRTERSSGSSGGSEHRTVRVIACRLLPACGIIPTVLWWIINFGMKQGFYSINASFVIFVVSVTLVFGITVSLTLIKLAQMDAQRAQAEEELKLAKEAGEEAARSKSLFFATMSHEIRTPLTAINGFAELLLNPERSEEERMSDARVIRRNGEHLLTLINDIMDLSKIEAGKISVENIPCSPAELVGEVCAMLKIRAGEKGLTLEPVFEGLIPKAIRTDPTRLRQILINLISNALKFTDIGGVKLLVSIKPSLTASNPVLECKVVDSGIGMTPDHVATLFQPFSQGDASVSRQFGGSGLGLSISQLFARALGGDIVVTSIPGKGSTFTVTVETGNLKDVPIQPRPEQAMDVKETFEGPSVRIAGSVLLAEDGIDNQALIATRLREMGLQVDIAFNGQIAVEKAMAATGRGTPFDLILMDVQMPVMDGFNATLDLRSKGYRGPIIALTANAMDRDRTKCLNAGCNDFVTKPIQMEQLLKAMGRFLKIERVSRGAVRAAKTPAATAEQAA